MSVQENESTEQEDSVAEEVAEVENTDDEATELEQEKNNENTSNDNVDVEALQSQLDEERELVKENMDVAIRAQAEMENLRKRTTRDIENAHKYALEKFVNELLPVIDSMELGMSATENAENIEDLKEGMELTLKMLNTAMEKFGVKKLEPQGEKFNPEQHEAVSMQEVEGKESGTVITVMQKGYELNGRLVRPAMVVVAK